MRPVNLKLRLWAKVGLGEEVDGGDAESAWSAFIEEIEVLSVIVHRVRV